MIFKLVEGYQPTELYSKPVKSVNKNMATGCQKMNILLLKLKNLNYCVRTRYNYSHDKSFLQSVPACIRIESLHSYCQKLP